MEAWSDPVLKLIGLVVILLQHLQPTLNGVMIQLARDRLVLEINPLKDQLLGSGILAMEPLQL